MSKFRSCFSALIERFIGYRKASGSWNEISYGQNIGYFDSFCADNYQGQALSQEMVDDWCAKRSTETNHSNYKRIQVVRMFIEYLRLRGLSDICPPAKLKAELSNYVPHAFSDDELKRFFHACDSIQPYKGRKVVEIRRLTVPVFFRLLYSTGLRTTEARFLKRKDVDLTHGIVSIQRSKGIDQHYVAMHDTMTCVMARYDHAIDKLQPSREYFFQSVNGTSYSKDWVTDNFGAMWKKGNGNSTLPVPYDLRHHYAITNINNWTDDGFEFNDKLQYLSKAMGHRSIESTRHYYSIVPRLSDTIKEKTEIGFNAIVPEVIGDED